MATHKIIGSRAIDGVEPGGLVELDDVRYRQLARAGHVAWVQVKSRRSSTGDGSTPKKAKASRSTSKKTAGEG